MRSRKTAISVSRLAVPTWTVSSTSPPPLFVGLYALIVYSHLPSLIVRLLASRICLLSCGGGPHPRALISIRTLARWTSARHTFCAPTLIKPFFAYWAQHLTRQPKDFSRAESPAGNTVQRLP